MNSRKHNEKIKCQIEETPFRTSRKIARATMQTIFILKPAQNGEIIL